MAGEVVIHAEQLTKRYGATLAIDQIDLEVGAGEIVGILGPNGSGKTTTILMLLGLTEPTGGRAEVAGFDPLREPLEVKRRVGYLPDSVGFYDGLSARDNLAYTGRLAGLSRHDIDQRFTEALARVGLPDVGRDRVATFSRGMRQRLGLAEVLMKRPSIAILDEPTATLDPHSTQEFLGMIRGLKADGTAVYRGRGGPCEGSGGLSFRRPDVAARGAGVFDRDCGRLCRDPVDPRQYRRKPVFVPAAIDDGAGSAPVVHRTAWISDPA